MGVKTSSAERVEHAIRAVLPAGARPDVDISDDGLIGVDLGTGRFTAKWIGEGWLGDALSALGSPGGTPDLLVARRMSPGARSATADAGVGWLDESGAAEIARPGLVISRSGRREVKATRPPRWNASVIGTAEALLIGTRATVAEVHNRTGLSTGSATHALGVLTSLGLLTAEATRGRGSARHVKDHGLLLEAYADAAIAGTPALSLRVGTSGRDLMEELARLGKLWDAEGVVWAATGVAAAAVLGPYLGDVSGIDVFVDAPTPATLDALAGRSGLPPIEGGRVLLRPFPTPVTKRLSRVGSALRLAPWPRVYADVRVTGVRGEEAAEHLREVVEHAR